MSGLLDVREIVLNENVSIRDFLEGLDEFSQYQENFHSNIIRIKVFEGTKVPDLEQNIIEQFLKCGYQRIRDWLIKGPVLDISYQDRDISGYLLWRQRIHPERRFSNAPEAFREMGGRRSEYE